MAVSKPSAKTNWTVGSPDFGTITVEPNGSKKQTGWQPAEKPAHQFMNWIHWITDQWVDYFEDPLGQILVIDDTDSPYSATSLNRWLGCDTSSGAITINLPAVASNSGVEFLISKISSDGNTVTIDPNGAELINGQSTLVIRGQYDSVRLKEINGQWIVTSIESALFVSSTKTTTYSITAADKGSIIHIDSTSGSFDLDLPAPSVGFFFTVKDVGGFLSINPVTFDRFGVEEFEFLAADYVLESDFGIWEIYSDGIDWFLR